jgi:glycosyltransferase involved in cell wall biosynthesis
MTKLLWLSNVTMNQKDSSGSGSWLAPMAEKLSASGVEMGNISLGNVSTVEYNKVKEINQWTLPHSQVKPNGLPGKELNNSVQTIIKAFNPDLVHVWGLEGPWGVLFLEDDMFAPVLIELQGLKGAIAPIYTGDLTFVEQIKCIGLKELVFRPSIWGISRNFKRWGFIEEKVIKGSKYFSVHSDWMKAQVVGINSKAVIYRNNRVLRHEFYRGIKWDYKGVPTIFCSASYPSPFKGLHNLIRCLPTIKKKFPNIQLRIAGPHQRKGLRQEGYIAWINREIHRLDLSSNIVWLGAITAAKIIDELLNCSVSVYPSFIESYGVAFAESLKLGVPSVAAYSGGTSFLAEDEVTALFFPAGDVMMCAFQIQRLLTDERLAKMISNKAFVEMSEKFNPDLLLSKQIEIYGKVLESVQ